MSHHGNPQWHIEADRGLPRNMDGQIVSPKYVPETHSAYLAAWRTWIKANPDQSRWPVWLRGDIQLMRANGKRSRTRFVASMPGNED